MSGWKYCFPHVWERPRQVWEDVYLLPDIPGYLGPGLHLTVDAFGNVVESAHGSDRAAFQQQALDRLGGAEFFIDGCEMLIRQEDFSREELVAWTRVWLQHHALPVGELREAPVEEFENRIEHATVVAHLKELYSRTGDQ